MKNYLLALAFSFLALTSSAFAQSSYVVKDGNGNLQTIHSVNCSSQICPASVPIDTNGAPFGVTSNPFFMAFGTGATLPAFAATPTFNLGNINGSAPSVNNPLFVAPSTGASFNVVCTSGCGGGGGLSVPYAGPIGLNGTPIGFKDVAGNLQPTLGDTTNGQWVSVKASVPIAVTGTFFQATQPVSAASLPLPTGAATQTTLASILTNLGSPFQAGGSIGNTSFGISGTLPAFAATPTFNLGTLNGASTAALQTTGNTSLSSIDTKTPALGQALAAASVPVVLTSAQLATLTPLSTLTVTQATGTNLHMVCDSGCSSSTSPSFGAAFPSVGTPVGMSQGGLFVAMTGTSGNLNVQCANCSGSGVSTADKATFTAGSSLFAGSGGFFQTTATLNPLTTGQQGLFQVTAQRALFTNLRDSSGTELGVAAAPVQVSLANTAANATAIKVDGSTVTQPVSGTVTAAQASAAAFNATVVGTGTFAVQAAPTSAAVWGINTLGSTTAGQSGQLAFGAVTTAAPTYTTAQSNALSLTTAGALRVDGSGVTQPVSLTSTTVTGTVAVTQSGAWSLSANQSVNVAQVNGVTPLMGNGVTGTGSQRVTIASDNTAFSVNATVTQATSANLKAQVDPLTPASWGIATATQNSASATNGQLALGQFNTTPTTITTGNMSPIQLDANGNMKVNIVAGASSGAVAQGSTTSGQTGGLTQAAVTTAAPTYTTATTNPLSMSTAGDLRVNDALLTAAINGATPAGTNVIGKVGIDQTTPGTTNLVALAANQSVNQTQINGVAVSTGSGVLGTGTQRMALATDSPGIVTLGQTTKSASVPMAVASDQVGTAGTANATVFTVQGIASMTPLVANTTNGYPSGAIPETISATGTTAATTATLAAAVGKTTYICGFSMRSVATAAAAGNATVTGTITGTLNFTHGTGVTPSVNPNDQRFNPCIPASTTNTTIAVVSPAAGTGGVMSVTAWGYQL